MSKVSSPALDLPRGFELLEDPEWVTLVCHWCGWQRHYRSARLAAATVENAARLHYALSCTPERPLGD